MRPALLVALVAASAAFLAPAAAAPAPFSLPAPSGAGFAAPRGAEEPTPGNVLFRRSCMECPATHEYCEYGYPGAPADHVACTAALEQASLYKRYVTPDSGVQSQSVIDACEASPCLNGGTCSATGASTFSCTCPEPFTGATCETVTNYCLVGKCLNGATCTFLPTTAPYFDCTCAPGFNGTLCENAYFKCPGSGSQGDPEKCYRYFVCSGVNGLFTRKTCPKLGIDQFLFDTTTKLCKSSTKSPVTIAGCSNT